MRACLDGRELPPWDVVEALLQDLAGEYGPAAAGQEAARALHAAAVAAFDSRPGARDALGDHLDVMLREQHLAADRVAWLGPLLGTSAVPEETEAIRRELAWAHDDHHRATSRCAEIRVRIERLEHRARRTFAVGAEPSGTDGDGGKAEEGGEGGNGGVGTGTWCTPSVSLVSPREPAGQSSRGVRNMIDLPG